MSEQFGDSAHATHYQHTKAQPIEIMQEIMTPEGFQGFLHGNVIKYMLRCNFKNTKKKDLEKAKQYLEWLLEALDGKTINPKKQGNSVDWHTLVMKEKEER